MDESMKAMEAPKKIYLTQLMLFATPTISSSDNDVEYIRTDAFIEKACEFMCNNIDKQLTIYHNNTWRKRDEFIEAFRQFMKEEKV